MGLSHYFAEILLVEIILKWPDYSIVPVPPRREALRERGWDQMELIACLLEKKGRAICRVLERLPSLEQKTLGLEARRENARKAYRILACRHAPAKALLIDDVFTSGSTAEACAAVLKAGGSETVVFVALAAD
jgi:predicted amidophosphoribosyltransferase